MEFRNIDVDIEKQFRNYINEWYENDEHVVPWSTDEKQHGGFKKMLDMQKAGLNPTDSSFVKAETFVLIVEDEIVGASNIRYGLNASLRETGGHIGYGVGPKHRGKGYATEILTLSLEKLKENNIKEALITCNEPNIASARVIMNNGGIEVEPFISENQEKTRRFWITID
ncbi:GNAT family N-acetyltransferase [Mammaliicoccus sp. Dog046]|uniref:GNAT family N-acetyltransferase n=1 Tax=Mammaliicoccus sp. Dog046 TaxID=3034233 RepID=UPI002B259B3A|nr:GNAT family N-acetyltransferase [Mammaliicoccus sp. Dog046]WQK84497.1 GNAT family N-acetyltransferase [Mammaliicoccus sp. Dog046]